MTVHTTNAAAELTAGCTLRRCVLEDAAALAQIGAATFLETYAGWLPGRDILAHCGKHHTAAAYAELLSQSGSAAWLAEVNGAPVGYLVLSRPEFPAELVREGDIELMRIYLFSRFHASGVAALLLREAETHAAGGGSVRMLVGLHRQNERAFRFYRRQGFEEIGSRMFQMGSMMYDDPVLAKPINAGGRP